MTEHLVSVAIIRDGEIHSRGFKEHWKIRAALNDADPYQRTRGDQEGFLTNDGRFVTRSEAVPIAVAAKQLSEDWLRISRELLSSDLRW